MEALGSNVEQSKAVSLKPFLLLLSLTHLGVRYLVCSERHDRVVLLYLRLVTQLLKVVRPESVVSVCSKDVLPILPDNMMFYDSYETLGNTDKHTQ